MGDDGRTGFHLACVYRNVNVVGFLLQQGFDMNARDDDERTGFHYACLHGNLNVVEFLFQQGFDWNRTDNLGRTGFHKACRYGNLNVVQFLVRQGFDMNIRNNNGSTGFHFACFNGKLNVVQFLVQQGFDINVRNNDGNTGFHYACFCGRLNVVQFLLQQGFDGINERDGNGVTRLEVLIKERYHLSNNELLMPCILLLIEAGAELRESYVFEELPSAIQNRIIEITFMKEIIFEKWTGRIAQAITDFTMHSFTNTSLQNLSQFLD